jgi:hypothetical protein
VTFTPRLALLLLCSLFFLEGCAFLHSTKREHPATGHPSGEQVNPARKPSPGGFFSRIFHRSPRQPPPPKATALRRIGTVTTVSNDGSYVIVELAAGMTVGTGASLLITATGGEPARLKVAELELPYFVADIESGHPSPGDPVMQ